MRPAIFVLLLLLTACDAAPTPDRDAGASDAAGEGDFAVLLSRQGSSIVDASRVPVDFGCQGGAHVELDVTAMAAAPMRGASFEASVVGGPVTAQISLRMTETADGAEALAAFANFGEFGWSIAPDEFEFPRDAQIQVSVSANDGSTVTIEREVMLEMGSTCTCTYNDPVPGAITVGSFRVEGEATGCEPVNVTLEGLTFTPAAPDTNVFFPAETHSFEWPAQCVDALGLAAGGELSVELLDSFPGQPCDPTSSYVGPSVDDFGCGC